MILDREGDLVLTDEDNLLRLDVGGFLMLATGEEIEQRTPQRQALRGRQLAKLGLKLEPVAEDGTAIKFHLEPVTGLSPMAKAYRAYKDAKAIKHSRAEVFPLREPKYQRVRADILPDGTIQLLETLPLPELTEPPQPDCCVGR